MPQKPFPPQPSSLPRKSSHGPKFRIKKKSDFYRVQNSGRKLHTRNFLLLVLPSETDKPRLGITITTKVDSRSVARNKLRRRLKEIFRTTRTRFKEALDIVVIARRDACTCELDEIKRQFLGALHHAGLLKDKMREA